MVTINLSAGGIGIFSEYAENTGGVFQGAFSDSSINSGAVATATFSGTSTNNGVIIEIVDFTESSLNSGYASIATFSNSAVNTGTISTSAEFIGNSLNNGVVNVAAFADNATNTGTVSVSAFFTGSAVNSGTIVGDAIFADTTTNAGTVQGNAQIAPTATNSGTVSGSTTIYYPPISGHYSVIFDSIDASVEAPFSPSLDLSTSDFTIEGWINPYTVTGQRVFLGKDNVPYLAYGSYTLYIQDGVIACTIGTADLAGYQPIVGSISVSTYTWTHVALTRDYSANTVSLFVNGVLDTTTPLTLTMGDGGRSVSLGKIATVWSGGEFVGKMSNFRIIKGQVLYAGTFTVPDAAYTLTGYGSTNQSITGTVSLLALQSSVIEPGLIAHGTVVISDDSPWHVAPPWYADSSPAARTVTLNGTVTQSDEGGGVKGAAFSSSYLSIADNSAFDFGSGDFTIEAFIKPSSVSGETAIITTAYPTDASGVNLANYNGSGYILAGDGNWIATTNNPSPITSFIVGKWAHVAYVRSGNNFTLYVNGLSDVSFTSSTTLNNINNQILVGGRPTAGGQYFSGSIANVRVVKGNTLYTGNFTVPTTLPTAVTGTQLLLNFGATAVPAVVKNGYYSDGYYVDGVNSAWPLTDVHFTIGGSYGECTVQLTKDTGIWFAYYSTSGGQEQSYSLVLCGDGVWRSNDISNGTLASGIMTPPFAGGSTYRFVDGVITETLTMTSWTGSYQDCTYTNTHGNLYTDNATISIGVKVYTSSTNAYGTVTYTQDMSTHQLVVGDNRYYYSGGEIVSIDTCSGY